ncbi:hypothetical protein ACTXT7_013762 [Hymenolepis weldensis]
MFQDENFKRKHSEPCLLFTANAGPNTNDSQFFLALVKTVWLACESVVFCKVVEAIDLFEEMGNVGTQSRKPKFKVTISNYGNIEQWHF